MLFAWAEEEEEGAMGLPCLGWFDECDDVLKILEKIREARINNKNLRIKGQTKTDALILSANYVKIENTDYRRIRIIYNPKTSDYTFNPLKYEYYDQEYISNEGSDRQYGFVYYDDNMKEVFKILVDETDKRKDLEEYLYGAGITFEVKCNDTVIKENSYLLISSVPEMPKLEVKNTSTSDILFRLKIEYKRDIRNDEDYFPEKEWQVVKSGNTWKVDFGNKIRGGKATLIYKIGEKEHTFVFYIRGTNPTEQEIKNYITQQGYNRIWFLTRLIRQESSYKQFNSGTKYGPDWEDYVGCPNHGSPHGWGLMQLDVLNAQLGDHQALGKWRPSAQALWDWKENIRVGVAFLEGEKKEMVEENIKNSLNLQKRWYNKHPDDLINGHEDQTEGNNTYSITYAHANSVYFNYDFGGNPAANKKSFMEASWIKSYNGNSGGTDGYPGFYYVLKQLDKDSKPFWDLHRTNSNNENYVGFVSGQKE
jgi:hypothetical protein